jgi:hypothetical protein
MKLKIVRNVMSELEKMTGIINEDDLFEALEEHQISRTEAIELIGILRRDGTIHFPLKSDCHKNGLNVK